MSRWRGSTSKVGFSHQLGEISPYPLSVTGIFGNDREFPFSCFYFAYGKKRKDTQIVCSGFNQKQD
jgi:hypothetical protein